MPSFTYQQFQSPYANTIAELIAHGNDARAAAAQQIAEANARAGLISANAWGGAISDIARAGSNIVSDVMKARQQAPIDEMNRLKAASMAKAAAGQRVYDSAIASAVKPSGDQLPADAQGPRQPALLTEDGLYDIPKISAMLDQAGYGSISGDLMQNAEKINQSITDTRQKRVELAKQQTITLGYLSDAVQQYATKMGVSTLQAFDAVVQPGLGGSDPQQTAQLRTQLAGMSDDEQAALIATNKRRAAQLLPTKTVGEGGIEFDAFGNVVARGEPKPPSKASLAKDAASGDPIAIKAMGFYNPAPRPTDAQQALEDYRLSLVKQGLKAPDEPLTDADRQAYIARQMATQAAQHFAEFQKERQYAAGVEQATHAANAAYDAAHPTAVKGKSQDQLESEMRQGIRIAFTNRSGGVGREDQKVAQANHALQMLHDSYDPKSQTYNLSPNQYTELALNVAQLMSPTGNIGVQLVDELQQPTMKGNLGKMLTFVTGTPFNGTTQEVAKQLYNTVQRQGQVAVDNRDQELGALLNSVTPTDLEDARRQKISEGFQLVPLRQSKVLMQNGQPKLFISIDGGKTWK